MLSTEGYKWDNSLGKVIITLVENKLKDIDRNWIQNTENYTIHNKCFDIDRALVRTRIMENRNKSLNTVGATRF